MLRYNFENQNCWFGRLKWVLVQKRIHKLRISLCSQGVCVLNVARFRMFVFILLSMLFNARSKAWVYGRSLARIVGSNPTGGMDVCVVFVV
jgi:hypothetical protein